MGSHYRAEVSLKYTTEYDDVSIVVEGRADGIFTEDEQYFIDEIKGVYADVSQLEKPVEVHRAQAMCYACIYAREQQLEKIGVQMTYGNLDTEELKYFREEFTLEELKDWYQELLDRYHKWISYQLAWKKERNDSMEGLEFPFEYREGQRKIVSSVSRYLSSGSLLPESSNGEATAFHRSLQKSVPESYMFFHMPVHYKRHPMLLLSEASGNVLMQHTEHQGMYRYHHP